MMVFILTCVDGTCAFDDPANLLDEIVLFSEEGEIEEVTIEFREMSELEFECLGEFNGW